jgi:glucose/arabinose dehydrogenase
MASPKGCLYGVNTDAVLRFAYQTAIFAPRALPSNLAGLPGGGAHLTRTVEFGADERMCVSIGSRCNVCDEADPRRAAVWV